MPNNIKPAHYIKLFRIDGKIDLSDWISLVSMFYKGNETTYDVCAVFLIVSVQARNRKAEDLSSTKVFNHIDEIFEKHDQNATQTRDKQLTSVHDLSWKQAKFDVSRNDVAPPSPREKFIDMSESKMFDSPHRPRSPPRRYIINRKFINRSIINRSHPNR